MVQIQCIESQKSGCSQASLRARGQNRPEFRATRRGLPELVPIGLVSYRSPFSQSVKGTHHEDKISKNASPGLKFGLIWPKSNKETEQKQL